LRLRAGVLLLLGGAQVWPKTFVRGLSQCDGTPKENRAARTVEFARILRKVLHLMGASPHAHHARLDLENLRGYQVHHAHNIT
jgi:hypothetical protein